MSFLSYIVMMIIGYLLGSFPSGLSLVWLATRQDLRKMGSGRTGGTNAGRAGGTWVGIATGILDAVKALIAVLIARYFFPELHILEAFVGLAAVLGHNYSLFLMEWVDWGKMKRPVFRGGAGGAPTVGAAMAFWWPSVLFVVPIGLCVFLFIGYASVTTLVGGLIVAIIFTIRAIMGISSWAYAIFGYIAVLLLAYALRPNLKRLRDGNERLVGLRAWFAGRQKDAPTATQKTLTLTPSAKPE
jgi:acyl phosphate:glycerol-3-phosphate acyltransferase